MTTQSMTTDSISLIQQNPCQSSGARQQLRSQWIRWIDETVQPTAFITVLMPHATVTDSNRTVGTPRSAHFYLSLLTRRTEDLLFGKSSRRVPQKDRCVWIKLLERQPFLHAHLLVRLPDRPLRVQRVTEQALSADERLIQVEHAVKQATALAPEAFGTGQSLREHLREDIQVKAYGVQHAHYLVKKLDRNGDFQGCAGFDRDAVLLV